MIETRADRVAAQAEAGKSGWTILVAEDDRSLSKLITKSLQKAGYQTISALTGAEALSRLEDLQNVILLLNLKLPDMDGEEIIQKISLLKKEVPFIVLTGQGDETVAVKMMKLGARDYLTKDLNIIEMLPDLLNRLITTLQTENKIRETEYFLKKAQEMGHIGTWKMDIPNNDITWTEENYRIFGISPEKRLNLEDFLNCVHPEDKKHVAESWNAALRREPYDIEHRILVEGKVKWVMQKAEIEFDGTGKALKGIGFTQDITDRKEAQIKLQKEMAATQRYLDLAGVMLIALNSEGNIILINRKGANILDISESEALGMNWFENFLAAENIPEIKKVFQKLMSGKEKLVEYYQNTIKTRTGETRVMLFHNTVLTDENNKINGILSSGEDVTEKIKLEEQLRQSEKMRAVGQLAGGVAHDFNNIMGGIAGYAMPKGGNLKFTSVNIELGEENIHNLEPGNYIELSIEDTGTGMDEATRSKVFEPFFTTKEIGKGTGLGLASVFGTVKQHNGHIAVNSEKGRGSVFKIYLPVSTADEESGEILPASQLSEVSGRIMLVDDEILILEPVSLIMNSHGLEVESFNKAEDSVEYYSRNYERIDAVVIDMLMPGMSGLECYRKLKQINPHIKAILATGFMGGEDMEKIKKEGVTTIFEKPYRVDSLITAISGLITRSRD